jgi:osmotically-inducible protein OsmY
MIAKTALIRKVHGLLEREPRINLHRHPLKIDVQADAIVLEGDVADLAAKKLALELAASVEGPRGVVDRLRIVPSERRGDGAIRDVLRGLLLQQPELRNCTIGFDIKGSLETARLAATDNTGEIAVAVDDGVITFEGRVLSLSHKRLVGVLAWWTPGCRDVVNSLDVVPAEEDNDDEVADALRLVLAVDPLLRTDAISVRVSNYVVTLEGQARTDQQRRRAEFDAWALFAVDKVINRIELRG